MLKPFEMDYTIVFTTLCEVIAEAYSKFDTQDPSTLLTIVDHDHFHKIENRLKVWMIFANQWYCCQRE